MLLYLALLHNISLSNSHSPLLLLLEYLKSYFGLYSPNEKYMVKENSLGCWGLIRVGGGEIMI